jgi:hypothetical protein
MVIPGFTTSIGSTKVRIQDLEELGNLTPGYIWSILSYCLRLKLTCIFKDISLELFDMGKKTGVVVVRFTKVESPPVAKPSVPANVPSGSAPPLQALSDKKKLQNAGYQSQDISMDQVICHWKFWVWTFSSII